ncbi:MAG: peptide chain release factor N(5)-glutamine methyltransferase [Erysipelotrichaceae bacterium]|nr:peptide chain release factor N(5)-glutamine methyltransferase [Erysipelotrichaceae bacterium]
MIATYRQIYFLLKKENNPFLSDSVIKEYLCFVGNFADFTAFFMHIDDEIDFDFDNEKLALLRKGKPVQQVTGYQYFCGHKLYVDENVLIPRQETESLVEIMRKKIDEKFVDKDISLLDLCCGSGAIGLSLSNKHTALTLSDISPKALDVAKKNSEQFKYKEVEFAEGDLFSNIKDRYDVIVCNPPYIENEDNIDPQVREYEPMLALLAKPGYLFYERILSVITNYLNPHFIVGFEIEEDMEEKLTELINKYLPKNKFSFYKDICNKIRFVIIESD